MPPVAEKLSVEHRGTLSFHVASESKEEAFYLVDMEEHGGNGACSCRDFQTRCFPHHRDTGTIIDYGPGLRTRCKHINAVILWIGNEAIRRTLG